MLGYAVLSFPDNGIGGFVAQGLGTSMLQVPNLMKKPVLWIPPTITAAVTGALSTCVFRMRNNGPAISSGMGTSGPVSYTHLDVYKRQILQETLTTIQELMPQRRGWQ